MRTVDRHRYRPIPFRPAEGDRLWLLEHAKAEGLPVNKVLGIALKLYRAGIEQAERED